MKEFCQLKTGPLFHRLILSVLLLPFLLSSALHADEEYEKFLNSLKDRGESRRDATFYQVAFDYLNYLETTDLVSDAIKKSLNYEKGTLLITSAKYIKNPAQREKALATGKQLLEAFIRENEFHPYVSAAKNELANLLIITARRKIREDENRNTDLIKSARQDFVDAFGIVEDTREALKKQLQKIPVKPTDPRMKKRRTEFENEFLRARLMLPSIQEELADTYPEGSGNRIKALVAAADEFADVNKDYHSRTAGQLAWLYRGRCLAKMGKPKEAIAVFREIFEQPDSPEFRELKRMGLEMAFPIWLDEQKMPNGFIEAVKVTEPIIATLAPQESRSSNWLRVRLNLARAYRAYYEYLVKKPEKTQDEKIQQTKLLQAASTAARFVASSNTDIKSEAQKLLVEWGARVKVDPKTVGPPRDFVEARERATAMIAEIEIIKKTVANLENQLANNPPNREELLKQLDEANQSLVETPRRAIEYLQLAVSMSPDNINIEQINRIRYEMCFCYFILKDYFRAALIGEFLLDRFPSVNGSRESAAIAMYSYWDLYQAASPQDKQFEVSKVDKICSRIIETWPESNEAAEATRMLIAIAIEGKQLDRAVKLLDRIPNDSPQKASIELNTGQAIWIDYLREKKAAQDAGKLAQEMSRLVQIRNRAESLLTNGIASVTGENLNRAKAKSLLSLAKILAEKNDGPGVLKLMENPDYGLLKFARSGSPDASDPRFRLDLYRTALKGYVLSISPSSDAGTIASAMDKANSIMNDLKKVTGEMENGSRLLVSLYYAFANDIKTKMDSIPSVAARKNFSTALADFLNGAAAASRDFQVVMWAASTLIKVADSFQQEGETDEAAKLFAAADNVLQLIDKNGIKVSDKDRLDVLRVQAKGAAGRGDFEKAIPIFVEFLTAKPATLDVQIDAALALQNAGEKSGETSYLVKAIMGGGEIKDPKTSKTKKTIWGWGKLSQAIANMPKFKSQFLIARYNLAKSRLLYHRIKPSKRLLDLALKDIDVARKKYPDLGGPKMKADFDKLIQEIKSAQ